MVSQVVAAFVRLLVRWMPFLSWILPGTHQDRRQTAIPPSRIAIIGAGVGGCSAAYFLRELCGEKAEIHVLQKAGVPVGGRAALEEFTGHLYETGAGIIHTSNKYLDGFARKFGLERKGERKTGTAPVGIFDGKRLVFQTRSSWKLINTLVILWHYGITSVLRMHLQVRAMLGKFTRIYDMQAEGRSFCTVPEMLQAMGGQDMLELTRVSAEDYLTRELGWPEKLVKELVTGALLTIYGQNAKVNAFAALASLVAMEGDQLWSVVGGNRLLAEKALLASAATLHQCDVCTIQKIRKNGKTSYAVLTKGGASEKAPELPSEFDVVIVANPLNTSSITFEDFSVPVYTESATTPYQRTVVTLIHGEPDPTFFGLDNINRDFPQYILTTDLKDCPINFNALHLQIPAEISADDAQLLRRNVMEGRGTSVWRLSSPKPLTKQQKHTLFKRLENEKVIDWLAYPKYSPPDDFPPFILDDGVFYINGIEKAASAMEMSAIGAKNVALLAREYLAQQVN